jgi:hypothetical protein
MDETTSVALSGLPLDSQSDPLLAHLSELH